MDSTLRRMMEIAEEAALEILRVYERPFSVDYKAPADPITEADRVANALICERLHSSFPDIPVVAEESPPEQWADYRKSERVFFVDPVDGTREFIARSGQFAVMIGLLDGERPSHGLLLAPAQKTIWAGVVGQGAFRIDASGTQRTLTALQGCPLSDATVASSRSQQTTLNQKALKILNPKRIVPMGSAGLKGAAIADGRADIYLAPAFAGCLWDSCAPEALVRSAGGIFTDTRGNAIDYRAAAVENNRGAVAAAPALHSEVIARLSPLFR